MSSIEPSSKRSRPSGTLDLTVEKSRTEILTGDGFVESIDSKMCQRLLDCGLLKKKMDKESSIKYKSNEDTHIRKLIKKISNNELLVSYNKPKSGYGRVNPKGAFSLGSLRKEVRHTLCGDDWIDFDVAKCHNGILDWNTGNSIKYYMGKVGYN